MLKTNPKFVLRNHLGEEAIRAAKDKDFSQVAALLALLGAWALRLRRTLDWARANHRQAGIWVASLAGLSVTAFAGLLNTSLHHEHGLLAMATLGMLLAASAPPRGAPA